MGITTLYRLLFGLVTFRAYGGFAERFVNLCAACGIKLLNVSYVDNGVTAQIKASNYRFLRPIAKKSGMKLKSVEKRGLVFFLRRHRERYGLAIGAAFFCIFMSLASIFIWQIDCVGSEKLSGEQIVSAAAGLGLYRGCTIRSVDAQALNKSLMSVFSGRLSWVSVNIKGSRVLIEVRDYIERREDETYSDPCNIVADFSGLLMNIQVFNGRAAVSEGSAVKKGDLLISGMVENRDTSTQLMEARGKISALHTDVMTVSADGLGARKIESSKSVYSLGFFSLRVPLGFFSNKGGYDEFQTVKRLRLSAGELPFELWRTSRAYGESTEESEFIESVLLFDEYTMLSYDKYKNTAVMSRSYELKQKSGVKTLTVSAECIDFIGKKQQIKTENFK